MNEPIPFNKPGLVGPEIQNIEAAIRSGHTASGGRFSKRASEILQQVHGAADVLMTTSCTDALEMSAMLLGVGVGDEVIVPSFTFTSTALAFARHGASIRFCDIDPVTLGLDATLLPQLIGPRTKAIVTVHYAGVPSSIDELAAISASTGIPLVEDNAHGLFATHEGRPLGTFGRMSTLSFHETKNFICGEGGALVLNDPADVDAAHVLLDKGTNRRAFLDGLVDKYTWQGNGSSFGLSDILAAYLVGQLDEADKIRTQRRRVASEYRRLLSPVVEQFGVQLQYEPTTATPADHMFYVLLPNAELRPAVISSMRADGIHPTFHYVPLHSSPAGRKFSAEIAHCPVTDDVSARLVRLPFFNELSDTDIARVVDSLLAALASARTEHPK